VIATIYLTSPWAAIWRSWSLRTYRPFHTEPSRQKIWQRKHQHVWQRKREKNSINVSRSLT
jgi:hypothetical protein